MSNIAPYMKAVVGALVAGLTALLPALADGAINATEAVTAVIAFLVALGAVYAIPNKDPQAEHQDESVQPPVA